MKHFISIVIDNDGINESRDFVLDTVLNTANIGLLENTMEYEIYESENNTQVLSIPIARELNEKQQAYLAKKLANKLFDKGYNNFDIEFSLSESSLNEADPQAVAAVARTDDRGRSRIGTDAGDGLVWIVGNTNALVRVSPNDPRVAAQRAAISQPQAAAPAAPAAAAGNSTLRKGSRGPAVRKLQLDLGVQPADGVFGPATEAAVKDFQQRMMPGETADGIVGPKTNTAIQQSAAIDTGDNPEIEKSDPNSQFAALSGFATSRRGGIANNPSQVDAIKELQAELKRRGLLDGEVDGKYGPQTRAAVRAFQEQNDLYVDGDAGPRTIQKLMQRDDEITTTTLDDPQDQNASNEPPGFGRSQDRPDELDADSGTGSERIQGALPQDIRDQYNQAKTDKDYIAMLRLVDQYEFLYNRFAEIENPEGEGTMYDWLTAKAADDSSDFPGAEEPAVDNQQQAPARVAVGDVATQEQSDTLKAIDPKNYPVPGEELNQADVDALNDTDQLAADTIAALDANPAPQGELDATDQAQTGTDDDQQAAAGAEAEPAAEFPDIDAAKIGIAELQPGDRVIIVGQEAIVYSGPDGRNYYQFSAPGPATDAMAAAEVKRRKADAKKDADAEITGSGRGDGAAEPVEGPYKEGDEITDDIAAKLETLGLDPGLGGEPMTQEDADALNKGIEDGTIEGPTTETPELEIFDNQPRGYGMEQGKVIVKRG